MKIESNNPGPTVNDADKVSKDSVVSSCEQTRSNALSPTSTTVNSIEKDNNDLDIRTMSVGSKGSDTVASIHKQNNICDGITNVQVSGLVDGIEPKESGT